MSDGYGLFTECHRLYIQGVRRTLRERLKSAYCDNWFKHGVLPALTDNQRENLYIALKKEPTTDLATLLDAQHFGRIVSRNHAAAFSDAFTEIDAALRRFHFLASMRNEWAHIPQEGLPLPKVMSAIHVMREILVSLRCREALEIESMSESNPKQSGNSIRESVAVTEDSANNDPLDELAAAPLGLWQGLQSYLVLDSFVDASSDQSSSEAHVTVRVSNVAPASEGRPDVYFKSVELEVFSQRGLQSISLGFLNPGQAREKEFTFRAKELATIEFRVSGDVDPDRLFRFRRKGSLPGEVVRPLLKEFAERFEAIGIKEPLIKALAAIATVQPTMTLADASLVRKELGQVQPLIEEKVAALQELFREFHLNKQTTLGAQCHEVWLFLRELGSRIQAVDNAIGDTDPESIKLAASDLEQLQLAVLQVEDTIRGMDSSK